VVAVVAAVVSIAAGMLGFSPVVCTTHCEGQYYGKDADRVRHLTRCAAQSLVRVVQVNAVTILALQLYTTQVHFEPGSEVAQCI
jgi:hypothetical protein